MNEAGLFASPTMPHHVMFQANDAIPPVIIAAIYILASLLKEPSRKNFNAIMIGGTGAAYLSGGGFRRLGVCFYGGRDLLCIQRPSILPVHWRRLAAAHWLGRSASLLR